MSGLIRRSLIRPSRAAGYAGRPSDSAARRWAWIAAAVLLAGALPLVAQQPEDLINPDRPGIADGSQTIAPKQFQIEVGFQNEHDRGDDRFSDVRILSTPLLLRYGLASGFELRVEGNGYEHLGSRVFNAGLGDPAGIEPTAGGYAPFSIGMKYHFNDKPSLGVIARLFVPSGSGRFKSDTTTGDVRLAADLTLNDKWALNPNIGAKVEDGNVSALAALTAQYNINDKVNVFVDGGYADSAILLDGGGAWIVGRNTQFDASIGWRAHGVNAPIVFFAAGVSRRF